jgi:hypothetical protein
MGKLLIKLSGARPEILDHCPTEKIKFQSLGWAILITCAMAMVSMWFALTSAMGFNPVVSLPVALLWGFVIMGIDRWLVISMPSDGSRKFLLAVPRVLLALLLGSLISTPIVLRIFESEINNEIAIIKADRASAYLNSQEHSAVIQQVNQWTATVKNLDNVIASGGSVQINPQSDPQWQTLNKQRSQELILQAGYYKEWQCQLYGIYKGVKCPKGNGPLAQASENSYNQAVRQVSDLTGQMHARVLALQASDEHSQQVRLDQAKAQLPNAQAQLNAAITRKNVLQSAFDSTNEKTNGLLIRLQALDELSGNNPTLNTARLLLFLLFLVIECLPVSVKLLQQPGNYERILKVAARREFNDAHRAYADALDEIDPALLTSPDFPVNGVRDNSITERIAGIWRVGRTGDPATPAQRIAQPVPATARPEDVPDDSGDQDEPSLLEHALHQVMDARGTAGFTQSRRTSRAARQTTTTQPLPGTDAGAGFGNYADHDL